MLLKNKAKHQGNEPESLKVAGLSSKLRWRNNGVFWHGEFYIEYATWCITSLVPNYTSI